VPADQTASALDPTLHDQKAPGLDSLPTKQSPNESNDSSGVNVDKWFDRSNREPLDVNLSDGEDSK
jgi:hypothetical protein